MIMFKFIRILLPLLILMSGNVYGQNFVENVSKVGISAAPFLSIPVGTRANSLGGAFVAVADDASSLYWNPAGISRLSSNEFLVTHTQWIGNINHDFGGIVFSMGSGGAIGLSIISVTTDEMEVRTELEPEGTGEFFSVSDLAFGATYAKNLTDRFSIGFTGKYIFQKIWHSQAQGLALDFGTLFKTDLFNGLKIGAVITNFGPDISIDGRDLRYFLDPDPNALGNNERIPSRVETDPWPLPLNFQFGVSTYAFNNESSQLLVSLDALHPSDNFEFVNLGLEYIMNDLIFLRGGYKGLFLEDSEEGLAFGAGVKLALSNGTKLRADYSFQDFGRLSNINTFALSIFF